MRERSGEHPFLLTPHLLGHLPDDGREPSELSILLAGAFNLGSRRRAPGREVEALLEWWSDRLRTGSRLDAARGLVYDQRWADLIPGLFEPVGLWRDPGVNSGYWRAATSHFERDGDRVLVDGHRLRTFHFTGFEPERPDRLSKYDNRTSLDDEPVLAAICAEFASGLDAHGHAEASRWPYGFGATAGGVPLSAELRDLWDRAAREGAVRETPFTAGGRARRSWAGWPNPKPEQAVGPSQPLPGGPSRGRSELRERFPDPFGADREPYLAWAEEQAERRPGDVLGLLRAGARATRRPGLR